MGVNSELVEYFKNLTNQHVDLKGNFYRRNIDDILFKPRIDCKYPYFSLEKSEYNFRKNAGSISKVRVIAFCIIAQRSRQGGKNEEIALQDFCEDVCDDFLNRIIKDVEGCIITSLIGVDLNSVTVMQIPFDTTTGEVGYRVVIDVAQRYNANINLNKWKL